MPTRSTIALCLICVADIAFAADATTDTASRAIDEALSAYSNAYNAKDIDALAAVWAPDADFIDHRGRRYSGRDEIAALFRKALVEGTGYTISLNVKSRQFLAPDIAMDDGVLELTEPDGEVESGRYVTIWKLNDGKWFIQSVRDMPSDPETVAGENPLSELEYLVGEWQQDEAESQTPMSMVCTWKAPGKFMHQEYVMGEGDSQTTVTLLVGWDPASRTVRSWFFDSLGGFGEATWQRRGQTWQIDEVGVLPDGRVSSSTNQWEQVDARTAVWSARQREVDGHAIPDVTIKFVRQK